MKKILLLLFFFLGISMNAQPPSVMPTFATCDLNNDGFATFDLSSQIPAILNGLDPNTTEVSFYETTTDAQNGTNPIVVINAYTNIVPQTQTLYIRVEDTTNSQLYFSIMELSVSHTESAGTDGSLTVCDSSQGIIDLYSLITGEQSGGTWMRANGSGGTFNATTGTFVPSTGATSSIFIYTVNGSACPDDSSIVTITVNSCVVCGGIFTDPAGATANYANNSDYTVTINPVNVGDKVTVTFTAFNTETNWDALYVFNGNSISAPQIASVNPAGNVPGGLAGGYWGTAIPGPFTSTSADGSLTFRFRSDGSGVRAGWVANVTCAAPSPCSSPASMSVNTVTSDSLIINWVQPPNPDTSIATSWEILVLPCGSPAPSDTMAGTPINSIPYTITGLNPLTCYSIYIRTSCTVLFYSPWVSFNPVTTTAAPPICGGQYVDNGGASGFYANNSNDTLTICPTNPGEMVTVTFTAFDTEATWDALYVFDGNSTAATQIASTNPAANVPGGLAGGFWGTTIPGPFTSTSADGCLTFRFRSDNTQNRAGWIANVTCATPPTCRTPTSLGITGITTTAATVNWTQLPNPDTSVATSWEVLVLTAGSPIPTADSTGFMSTSVNPVTVQALTPNSCYTVYVRAVCSATDRSNWSSGINFCTQLAPPVCGGQFTDPAGPAANYANSSDVTTVICPTNPGEIVTVVFNTFDVEATWDALYVFDGNSIAAPQIASANPAGNVPGGLAGGFWGTAIPGPFVATSPDGCLTFRFRSDNTQNRPGWTASVNCAPDADKVVLVAFVDSNNNGVKDTGELLFPNGSFIYQQNGNGTNINGYSPTGQYALYDTNPANTYNFSYQLQSVYAPYYSSGTTTYNNISIAVGSGTQFLYFPITLTQDYNDVVVSISPLSVPRPGFTYVNRITYKNLGVATASGTITFAKPPQVTTFTVSQTGTINNVSGFTYPFTNLMPNEIRTMDVTMTVTDAAAVNTLLTATVTISAAADDINAENNSGSNSQIVVNSFDPNDKMESRGKTIPFNQFAPDDYFFYTIRFQNDGTGNAIDVRIEDLLNINKIDETSVLMVSASHNYTMKRINNQLTWDFKNIYLAPSSVNANGSKGYVQFKVKLKPGFQAGTIIPNNASIYFDTNPAIVTATFNSKFTLPLGVSEFNANSLVLYPNPATSTVQIGFLINTNEQLKKVVFYDLLGKTVKTLNTIATESLTVDVSDLSKGVYLVEIALENNLKLTKKLVIQ
jgi:hypothetical protein